VEPEDGISQEIDQLLANRKMEAKVDSWRVLWRILFPMDEAVPSSGK
jgi:hypothetical protein